MQYVSARVTGKNIDVFATKFNFNLLAPSYKQHDIDVENTLQECGPSINISQEIVFDEARKI